MTETLVVHSTFTLERDYAVPPARVFAAFADPAKKQRWFAEHGENHSTESFEMDFREGGKERAVYRFHDNSQFPGVTFSCDSVFLIVVPDRRVVTASTMDFAGHVISAALLTVELSPTSKGTHLVLTHQAAFFEGADGPERREEGWRKLLDAMAAALND